MKQILLAFFTLLTINGMFGQPAQYSWKYYTAGTTGILGDYSEALWIDHDGDPYIAAYTPGWEEGGFSKYIQAENGWINYSNVEYPVIGSIYDVGSSRISDIAEDSTGVSMDGYMERDPEIRSAGWRKFPGILGSRQFTSSWRQDHGY